jgi:hypothetical protein
LLRVAVLLRRLCGNVHRCAATWIASLLRKRCVGPSLSAWRFPQVSMGMCNWRRDMVNEGIGNSGPGWGRQWGIAGRAERVKREWINKVVRERGVRQGMTEKEKWESVYKRKPLWAVSCVECAWVSECESERMSEWGLDCGRESVCES